MNTNSWVIRFLSSIISTTTISGNPTSTGLRGRRRRHELHREGPGFGYGIGISIGMLVLITTITLASYFCTRPDTTPQVLPSRGLRRPEPPPPLPDVELSLDEATLKSCPSLLYSKAKLEKDSTSARYSICLADYKDTDMLRLLSDCGHLFHQKCVDSWLRMHPTCPLCRFYPMQSPLPTPPAEIVPLAASRVRKEETRKQDTTRSLLTIAICSFSLLKHDLFSFLYTR